jgi:predicted ATP-binding protein involved in virulence
MSSFLTKIYIDKIFHLEGINIELDVRQKKHLILTGKNGSGKTSVLNALVEVFQDIKRKSNAQKFEKTLEKLRQFNKAEVDVELLNGENPDSTHEIFAWNPRAHGLDVNFNDGKSLFEKINDDDYLFAYYSATRKTQVTIPKNPEKPDLEASKDIKASKIKEFVKFLVDLKVQEALARNEKQIKAADEITLWFANFTALLKDIFESENLKLDFSYRDYSFMIILDDRKFGFNEMSDGYSAIIDIVADLIIKMQDQNSLTRAYEKEGIVLIDEVETHLHLKLQRLILPMLNKIFPNIQFIVTTHSPFVLSSLKDTVAYDLERQFRVENLTEYSYDALAEGYFKVDTESNFLISKLDKFKELASVPKKDSAQLAEYQVLDKEFSLMEDALSPPNIKGQYLQIKLNEK